MRFFTQRMAISRFQLIIIIAVTWIAAGLDVATTATLLPTHQDANPLVAQHFGLLIIGKIFVCIYLSAYCFAVWRYQFRVFWIAAYVVIISGLAAPALWNSAILLHLV